MGVFTDLEAHELVTTFGGSPAVLLKLTREETASPSTLVATTTPHQITAARGSYSLAENRQLKDDETLIFVSPIGLEGLTIEPGDGVVLDLTAEAWEAAADPKPQGLRVARVEGVGFPLRVVLQ